MFVKQRHKITDGRFFGNKIDPYKAIGSKQHEFCWQ
jgi:hypothetical protein